VYRRPTSSEEYCHTLAIALEPPEKSGCPISQWRSKDLAENVKYTTSLLGFRPVKSAGFKKKIRRQTSSQPILAQSVLNLLWNAYQKTHKKN